MAPPQELVHKLDLVAGTRYFRYLPALLAVMLVALIYDLREYRNFSAPEAMDAAQLGRRIAEGKGYTTSFIRPLSMHLVARAHRAKTGAPPGARPADPARIREAHPDISNPPVYPVLLAGLMRVLPFNYTASHTQRFWSSGDRFWRYQPDFLIALFNELVFALVIALAFFWALRLFDPWVAWTAAVVLLGTEELWRFSVSGLPTMVLLVFFMALVWCLTLLESGARGSRPGRWRPVLLALAAGALAGLGGLTRYAFALLIIPTLLFIFTFAPARRGILSLLALLAFAAVMAPWIYRNYAVSGTPFGTATYHVLAGTSLFPQYRLERSLVPNLEFFLPPLRAKLLSNLRPVLDNALSQLGGGWVGGFFLAGLLVGFRGSAIRRIRYFLLLSLALLIVVQALGRTQLSEDLPDINSENLLVLLLPLVVIYGVSMFFTLLEGINFPGPAVRAGAIVGFGVLACLPIIFALFSRTVPVVYPPYHPLLIQQTANWMKPEELMMSDIPWAVAWYGDRQCVWLTLNAVPDPATGNTEENFFTLNNQYFKPVRGLYLTQKTTDGRFVSDWIARGESSWGSFLVDIILKNQVPANFPLRQMPTGYLPEQVFLSDSPRWR